MGYEFQQAGTENQGFAYLRFRLYRQIVAVNIWLSVGTPQTLSILVLSE